MSIEYLFHITKGFIHSLLIFMFLKIFFEIKLRKIIFDYAFFFCFFIIVLVLNLNFYPDWRLTVVSLILLSLPISRFFIAPFAFQWVYITIYISVFLSMNIFFAQYQENYYLDALKLVSFSFVIYLLYRSKKMEQLHEARLNGTYTIWVPFFSFLLLIYDCYVQLHTDWENQLQSFCRMVLIVILNMIYDRTINKMQTHHFLQMKQSVSSQNQENYKEHYYERLDRQQEEIRSIRHDMKNQLIGVWGELEDGKVITAKEELTKILNKISLTEQIFYTKNASLNAVLNFKADEMKRKHIPHNFEIKIPEQVKIDGKDMGILIGNVLDNAIEGCEKCIGKKQISLRLIYDHHTISMICENSTDGNVTNFKSRKENSLYHGLGIKSIKHLVKECGGEVDFMIFSTSFQVRMVLWNV